MEINWCQGSLDTKVPTTTPNTQTQHNLLRPECPLGTGLIVALTLASPRWINYKLNCGRHPICELWAEK